MADERVEIQIAVSGATDAKNTLNELLELINSINKQSVNVGGGSGRGGRGGGGLAASIANNIASTQKESLKLEQAAQKKRDQIEKEDRAYRRKIETENRAEARQIAKEERQARARQLEKEAKAKEQAEKEARRREEQAAKAQEKERKELLRKEEQAAKQKQRDEEKAAKEADRQRRENQKRVEAMERAYFKEQAYQKSVDQWEAGLADRNEIAVAYARAGQYEKEAERASKFWNTLGSVASGAGVLSGYTSTFASGIGQAFSGMGSMFNFDTTTIARRYITRLATRAVLGNLDASIARADIMNTFVPYMVLAGVDENTASSALSRINQSILGLPIGLDEAAQRLRRYQMFMGDTEAATNMTIGIQNAIMAGGASAQMKTQAYYQIDRLLSAGKLQTSRQWLALLQGLGVSTRFLAQEMGQAGITAKEMAAGLTSGEISTDDFLKAVQRLATNKDINKALEIYKNTYESWISNIGFAFKRGNANVLNALSDALVSDTGISTLGYMKLFRNSVNKAYSGVVSWLGENPNVVGNTVNSVRGFAGAAGGIDFGRIGSGILGNIGRAIDYAASAINRVSGGKLEDFISFSTTLAGPIGGVFKAVSGGLPAVLGVYDRFKDFNFEGLMDSITNAVGDMADVVSGVLSIIPDGVMSDLLSYGLVWGRPVGNALGALGGAFSTIGALRSRELMGYAALASWDEGAISRSPFASFMFNKWNPADTNLTPEQYAQNYMSNVKFIGGIGSLAIAGAIAQHYLDQSLAQDVYNQMYGENFIPDTSGMLTSSKSLHRQAVKFTAETAKMVREGFADEIQVENRLAENEERLNAAIEHRDSLLDEQSALEAKRAQAEKDKETYWAEGSGPTDKERYSAALQTIQQADSALFDLDISLRRADAAVARYESDQKKLNKEWDIAKQKVEEYKNALKTGDWTETALETYMQGSKEDAEAFRTAISDASKQGTLAAFFAGAENAEGVELPAARYYNEEYGSTAWRPSIKKTMESEKELIAAYDVVSQFFNGESRGYSDSKMKEGAEFVKSMLDGTEEGMSKLLGVARRLRSENPTEIKEFFEDAHTWAQQSGLLQNVETTATALNSLLDDWLSGGSGLVNYTNALAQFQPVAQETINTLNEGWKGSGGSKKDLVDAVFGGGADLGGGLGQKTANAFSSLVGAAEEATTAVDGVTTAATELDGVWKKGGESARGAFKEMVDAAGSAGVGISAAAGTMAASLSEPLGKAEAIAAALDSLSGRSIFATVNVDVNLPPGVTLEMLTNGFSGGSTTHENNGHVFGGSGGSFGSQGGSGIKPGSSLKPVSRGGVIYASSGMFIPHGTDTVPAMLTPGEYVVRRKAAAAFGKAFMDRVNALDIHGAFRALSHRMNVPSTGSFIANNQRTYDNHASVTQNIVTNSQSFTHRRARRWVRALT